MVIVQLQNTFMIIINSLKSSKQPQDGNIKKNITCFTIKMKNYTKLFQEIPFIGKIKNKTKPPLTHLTQIYYLCDKQQLICYNSQLFHQYSSKCPKKIQPVINDNIMNMNNLKGFVFYVDILGFSALTQGKIQLTEDDFNIWQVSKHFQTSGNQEFAANILIIFRKILANCQSKYPTVNFTQLSDCAFVSVSYTHLTLPTIA